VGFALTHVDRWTNMTKLTDAFRDYANVPKINTISAVRICLLKCS